MKKESSGRKKILILSLAYYPRFVGGAEIAIKEITDRIDSKEYEFHMITNRFDSTLPKEELIGNVHVHRIGFSRDRPTIADLKKFPLKLNKIIFQISAAIKAARLHRKYKFSVLWAMMAHVCGIPGGIFARFHPRVRFVLTLQEGDPPEQVERMMLPVWPLFKQGFMLADRVQTISHFLAAWAERMGHRKRPIVVPNAVDVQHFSREISREVIATIRTRLSWQEGNIFLITTSRLVHKNAVDDVIRALEFLPSHIRFAVLGTGPDEDVLRKLVQQHALGARVVFLGHIGHEDVPSYLKACDIFIRPSRSEGMGNSFVEAMAAGLPVIGTQEGGIADFLFDATRNPHEETTGWAVTANSPKEIAAQVLAIIQNPEVVAQVTKTAERMVREKYEWDIIAKDMEKIFNDVTA